MSPNPRDEMEEIEKQFEQIMEGLIAFTFAHQAFLPGSM
jgi:hypothetical protein